MSKLPQPAIGQLMKKAVVLLSGGVCDFCRIRDRALIAAGVPELATKVGQSIYTQDRPKI